MVQLVALLLFVSCICSAANTSNSSISVNGTNFTTENDTNFTDVAGIRGEIANASNTSNTLNETSVQMDVDVDDDAEISSNFLSFDEWVQKKANVKKRESVQNALHSKNEMKYHRDKETDYSVGEEDEIDIELFTGSTTGSISGTNSGSGDSNVSKNVNRFNFASLDCAATIIETNKEAKGASSILHENKEAYLLNKCTVKENFIVIELCEDILIDTITMGNYEFFSSIFKDVEFYISDRYPVSKQEWKFLGKFVAKNIRNVQHFKIVNPLIWARYLRIEIKSHYGNEYYCPLSIVRVNGRTMMEEYKLKESEDKEMESIENSGSLEAADEEAISNLNGDNDDIANETDITEHSIVTKRSNTTDNKTELQSDLGVNIGEDQSTLDNSETNNKHDTIYEPHDNDKDTSNDREIIHENGTITHSNGTDIELQEGDTIVYLTNDTEILQTSGNETCVEQRRYNTLAQFFEELRKKDLCEPLELLENAPSVAERARRLAKQRASASNSSQSTQKQKTSPPVTKQQQQQQQQQPPQANTQESIYKNIMKRLSLLESNATLSLLYIEEQSKLLSEAFAKLEKKQNLKFNLLVNAINETLQNQLEEFRNTFEDFETSSRTAIEKSSVEQLQTLKITNYNMNKLAHELQFQKRIVLLLFIIVVCLLVYVILTRDTFIEGEYLDEAVDEELTRFRYSREDSSFFDDNESTNGKRNMGDTSPTISESGHTSPASYKRKLKLKLSNKFGSTSSSTILLDEFNGGHRKTASNASSINSFSMENAPSPSNLSRSKSTDDAWSTPIQRKKKSGLNVELKDDYSDEYGMLSPKLD